MIGDEVIGNTKDGQPGDVVGNVQIFYSDGIVAGDRAHYDGVRTITVTGHPYLINRDRNSILHADVIKFDTVSKFATLEQGRGESTQGVEKGEVYFTAKHLTSTSGGVAHGEYASVTTCVNPRAGYHITGRTIDVKPGDKMTITKAVLFLGALAVFYIPKLVIPLRQVEDDRKPGLFPEVGYNQYEGYYVKAKLSFGKDNYYYGYYTVNYFTKVGLGLGYLGFFNKKNGRRQSSINYYGIKDRRVGQRSYNFSATDVENFSQTLRANGAFSYNGNFGALTTLPAQTSLNATVVHNTARDQQNYQFGRSAQGSLSKSYNYGFSDSRQLSSILQNTLQLTYNTSSSNYGSASTSSTSTINNQTQMNTHAASYLLTLAKQNSSAPYGIQKEPELQVRPNSFFPHFVLPVSAQFYIGSYDEPQSNFKTTATDMSFNLGPQLYHFFGSDLTLGGSVEQYAFATGDLKAKISQNASLQTPVGKHFVNSIQYSESNNNGPAFVPFQSYDILSGLNNKQAYDVFRFFNSDYYNLQISASTLFNGHAQPLAYQLTSRPSKRSILLLGGSFSPGSGLGFSSTNVQLATPFGYAADLQFITDIDWKNKGRLINKNIYYHKVIGDCYEFRVQYNQNLKQVNVSIDILAFPSHAASFGVDKNGPIFPTSLNF